MTSTHGSRNDADIGVAFIALPIFVLLLVILNPLVLRLEERYTVNMTELDKIIVEKPLEYIVLRGKLYDCMEINSVITLDRDIPVLAYKNVELVDPENNVWKSIDGKGLVCYAVEQEIQGWNRVEAYTDRPVIVEVYGDMLTFFLIVFVVGMIVLFVALKIADRIIGD